MNKLLAYDFEDAEEVDGSTAEPIPAEKALLAFPVLAFRDIRLDLKRRNYLVKGLLPRSGLVVIWGPPKCYKSFWTMDVAFFIAIGQEYRGRRVQQAPVVYIILEGREGLPARKEALAGHYGIDDPPLYFITTALNLAKHAEALAASIEAQLGDVKPGAVFIDTLNRSLVGSESKDEDMAAYLAGAGYIEQKFGCLVAIVHHCGVDASRPRGHTSLTGAVEVQLKVERVDDLQVVVTVEFAKDIPEGTEIASCLEVKDLGIDEDGDPVRSLIVVPSDTVSRSKQQRKVRGAKKLALDVLQKAINEVGSVPPASNYIPPNTRTISIQQWRMFADRATITESDKPDSQRKAFVRSVNGLLEANLIGKWGDYVWII